jgi:hypothetical protein
VARIPALLVSGSGGGQANLLLMAAVARRDNAHLGSYPRCNGGQAKSTIDGNLGKPLNIANGNNATLGAGGTVGGADGVIGTAADDRPLLTLTARRNRGTQGQAGSTWAWSLEKNTVQVCVFSIYGFLATGGLAPATRSGAGPIFG